MSNKWCHFSHDCKIGSDFMTSVIFSYSLPSSSSYFAEQKMKERSIFQFLLLQHELLKCKNSSPFVVFKERSDSTWAFCHFDTVIKNENSMTEWHFARQQAILFLYSCTHLIIFLENSISQRWTFFYNFKKIEDDRMLSSKWHQRFSCAIQQINFPKLKLGVRFWPAQFTLGSK